MYVVSILNSVLVLGTLGLIFGAILAYASKKFAVDVDERVESILDVSWAPACRITVVGVDFQAVEVLQMQ